MGLLLLGKLALHDIDDVEDLCARRARRWCQTTGTGLTASEFEDLVAYLVADTWQVSERFDPAKAPSFRAIVIGQLGNRATDWFRKHRGRTRWKWSDGTAHTRERPQPLSLSAPAGDGRTLGETLADRQGDPETGRGPSPLGELLRDRDRGAARDSALCRAAARRVAGERALVKRYQRKQRRTRRAA